MCRNCEIPPHPQNARMIQLMKIEFQSPHSSSSLSSLERPEVEKNEPQIVNCEPFMGNRSSKHKLESSEHRETPDGSAVALKQSRLEDAPGSPIVADISTPSQEDVPENTNSSALKMAFENFTRDLKRKFELRLKQREIPLSSEKAKEVPACLIRLWNQIHTCRQDKLEGFHSSVLQELGSLEKDLQTLECLEKDALEFWERQSADLQSFCDQQVWRGSSLRRKMEMESGVLEAKNCPSELHSAANSPSELLS